MTLFFLPFFFGFGSSASSFSSTLISSTFFSSTLFSSTSTSSSDSSYSCAFLLFGFFSAFTTLVLSIFSDGLSSGLSPIPSSI